MRFFVSALIAGMTLTACQSSVKPEATSQAWQPSTLSQQTLDKVHERLRVYEQCVNDETHTHLNDKEDSRRVTDLILQSCEDELSAVKAPFQAEQVPDQISERYLRSKRSLAAQQVLRVVMATQAVRSANEPSAKP
ncbi:hypothetical protein [Methylomagnum sp.]